MEFQPALRCIDRVLPSDVMRLQQLARTRGGATRAIAPIAKLWPTGTTLHVRFLNGTSRQKQLAQDQAFWWVDQAGANLRLVFDDSDTAEIRVSFNSGDGAWSYVGTDNKYIPRDQPTMNLGFMTGGTTAHEFGHAIGLGHEHQNPKGGLQWNEPRVLQDLAGPPNYWTEDEIRHNVLTKYALDQIKGTNFDPESIMLYQFPATWTTNGYSTHANDTLSAKDRMFVREIYPGHVTTDRLEVNADWIAATIGLSGEEDLFIFEVTRGGRYVAETNGHTDLIMKLYGPNSETRLIGEDDDSGERLNPMIVADLVPGSYGLQIRHYSDSGSGEYGIAVRTAA